MKRPGGRLRAWAARLCDARTMERVIDPAIADLQVEYAEMRRGGAAWKAGWVLLLGYLSFAKVIAMACARGLLVVWTPAERSVMWRATLVFAGVTIVTTLVFVAPFFRYTGSTSQARLLLYVFPSALPLSVAIGATFSVIGALARESLTRKLVVAVVAGAFVCSIASFANMAWVVPDSNQAFREFVFKSMRPSGELAVGESPRRGDREMSMSELARQMKLRPEAGRRLSLTYHSRWSLAAAPLVLAIVALSMIRSWRRTRLIAMCTAGGLCVGYWLLLMNASIHGVWSIAPPALVAWSPNIVYGLLAALMWRHRAIAAPPVLEP